MAIVTLDRAYLHLATDPSQFVTVSVSAKVESPFINGSFNQYAGGRWRMVTLEGVADSEDITFTQVDEATRATIHEWIGQPVCYRDPHGTKIYGGYLTYQSTENMGANISDLEFKGGLQTITWSEAV